MKDEIKKYLEAQEKWLKETGVTIGSKVLVAFGIPTGDHGYGWAVEWISRMDEAVGQVATVIESFYSDAAGIRCHWKDGDGGEANFPFFVLVKVEE